MFFLSIFLHNSFIYSTFAPDFDFLWAKSTIFRAEKYNLLNIKSL